MFNDMAHQSPQHLAGVAYDDPARELPFVEVATDTLKYERAHPLPDTTWTLEQTAEHEAYLADLALIEQAGDPTVRYEDLTDAMRETLRRKIAAARDTAMLGGSGYERIEADFYPTPPENVDCLLEHFIPHGGRHLVWEPACGKGDISMRLNEYGLETWNTDLHDQGFGIPGIDFLAQTTLPNPNIRTIITNPPYADGLAEAFVRHAIKLMEPVRGQVAMFLRNEFDCGKGRMELFQLPPFHRKVIVTKRPRWIAGSTGSPRHNYSWFVWDWRHKSGSAGISYSHPDFAPGPYISPN
jgi:hypothetical protein